MAEEFFVNDVRSDGEITPNAPRCTTYAELQALFGLSVRRDKGWEATPPGQSCWKLVGFEVRLGIAAYIPQVKRADGSPLPSICVFRYWPDAPALPNQMIPYPTYYTACVAGFTDANGVVGFPYSGGSVVGEGGGPDSIWVSAGPNGMQPQFSDMAERLGWLGGTDHLTANPIFRLTIKESDTIPPPITGAYLSCVVGGQEIGRIYFVTDVPTGADYMALFVDGQEHGRVAWGV